jgi:diguanylate cyclase (GGDEF)-like protein
LTVSRCPLQCGYYGDLFARETAGVTVFICPECLGVAFDGGVICDARKPVDLSKILRPVLENILREVSIDPLTQVKNRRFFFNRLATELGNARHRYYLSVAGFALNASRLYQGAGSRAGDTVLQAVAASLLAMVRAGDNFARVEHDVFGLILPHADAARGAEIAGRVAEAASSREFHTHTDEPVMVELRHAVIVADPGDMPEQVWRNVLAEFGMRESHGA